MCVGVKQAPVLDYFFREIILRSGMDTKTNTWYVPTKNDTIINAETTPYQEGEGVLILNTWHVLGVRARGGGGGH